MNVYEQYPDTNIKTPTLTIWQQVLFSPSVETFTQYLPEADLMRAGLWIILGTLGSAIISMITTTLSFGGTNRGEMLRMLRNISPELARELPTVLPPMRSASIGATLCGIPAIVAIALLSTFITVGLIHLVAKLFQGQGSYTETFFLMSAAAAPMMLVTGALQLIGGLFGLIPLLGAILRLLISLLLLGLGIYSLVLTAMAVAAAHNFSLGKGFLSTILPTVVFFFLTCCCTFIAMVGLGGALNQGAIDEILREIGAYLTLHV